LQIDFFGNQREGVYYGHQYHNSSVFHADLSIVYGALIHCFGKFGFMISPINACGAEAEITGMNTGTMKRMKRSSKSMAEF